MKAFGLLFAALIPAAAGVVVQGCTGNNCARAVTGNDPKVPVTVRQSDCSSFLRTTVTLATSTVFETVTTTITPAADPLLPRQATVVPSAVPLYASACSGAVKYSSACSCWGITGTTITVAPTVTATLTATETVTPPTPSMEVQKGVVRVNDPNTGALLGYISKTLNPNRIAAVGPVDQALVLEFEVSPGSATGSNLELSISSENPLGYPFFGVTLGPSSTSGTLGVGSYNYVFLTPENHTPPNSPPANVGSSFSTTLPSESSVWSINSATGELTIKWTNPDGSALTLINIFASGPNFLSGTGDLVAYQNAFGSTRQRVVYTFEPQS